MKVCTSRAERVSSPGQTLLRASTALVSSPSQITSSGEKGERRGEQKRKEEREEEASRRKREREREKKIKKEEWIKLHKYT